ncbi:MAG: SurA N-terminal domain-containing protein [Nitrospiraceae bacterium]|nr:SurA N-terminal domain-containing protein [Nitrospiraceae bacterium]
MKKILALAAMLMLFACSHKAASGPASQTSASGDYIAKVNGAIITVQDYKEELSAVPEQLRGAIAGENGKEFLNQLINKELLYQEAVKKGLDKDPKLAKAIADFKKLQMVRMLVEDQIENKVSVSDQEVKSFYDENKDKLPKIKGKTVPFDRVKDQLNQYLLQKKQEKAFNKYMDGLKQAAAGKIEINEKALKEASAGSGAASNTPGQSSGLPPLTPGK